MFTKLDISILHLNCMYFNWNECFFFFVYEKTCTKSDMFSNTYNEILTKHIIYQSSSSKSFFILYAAAMYDKEVNNYKNIQIEIPNNRNHTDAHPSS